MPEPVRRFYEEAGVAEDGFGVRLDQRALKTSGGAAFRAPTRALAEACAAEWSAQGERILPASMPLTQLAFSALDHTPHRRDELAAHVAKFGETDLVCHRAEAPAALAERQAAAWDVLLTWAREALGLTLPVVAGVIAAEVPPATLARIRAHALTLDGFRLTALAQAAGLAGSALIALALIHGRIDGATAYEVATIDERWSLERWGEDAEARARLDRMCVEFENLGRFIAALEQT